MLYGFALLARLERGFNLPFECRFFFDQWMSQFLDLDMWGP
jgi:hypothetical protein